METKLLQIGGTHLPSSTYGSSTMRPPLSRKIENSRNKEKPNGKWATFHAVGLVQQPRHWGKGAAHPSS